MASDLRSLTLDADSLRLAAFERPGAGHPIVLLHGAGSNALSWLPLARALEGRHLVAVDLPSHGKSDAAITWNIYETADLVHAAVSGLLGDGPAIYGGHSWGGKLSGCIAAQHPRSVAGLVLIDPSPSHSVPVDVESFVDLSFGPELAEYPTAEALEEAARAQLPRYANWNEDVKASFHYGLVEKGPGRWTLRSTRDELRQLAEAVLWEGASQHLAKNASVPTLLLTASQSVWQAMTNRLVYAHADFVEIEGGHWIHMDDERAVADAVTGWMRSRRL